MKFNTTFEAGKQLKMNIRKSPTNRITPMNPSELLHIVAEKLRLHPTIRWEQRSDSEIHIFKPNPDGFDILLQVDERENTLCFKPSFHWHFDHDEQETDELLHLLGSAITGSSRLKQYSKNGKAYKWTLQIQDEAGNWPDYGTTCLLHFNFWTKPEISYLQNKPELTVLNTYENNSSIQNDR